MILYTAQSVSLARKTLVLMGMKQPLCPAVKWSAFSFVEVWMRAYVPCVFRDCSFDQRRSVKAGSASFHAVDTALHLGLLGNLSSWEYLARRQ